jgi:putative heme transporter
VRLDKISVTRRRLLLGLGVSLTVAALTFAYVLPKLAAYTAVWHQIRLLGWSWLLALLAAAALNIATFAVPWMIVLPGLGFARALKMTQASTAFGFIVPGGAPLGMAASFAMLRSAGFDRSRGSLAVALTGIWSQLSAFLFPVVAIALLAAQGTVSSTLQLAAVLGIGLLLLVAVPVGAAIWKARFSQLLGDVIARAITQLKRLTRKGPVAWSGESFVRYRADMLRLMRQSWPSLTIATLLNQLTGYLVLEAAVRAVGIRLTEVSIPDTFAAWTVVRLVTSLPITPGGIGVVELGLTGMLVGFGGQHAAVVAAVLVYRALSIIPTLALGLLATATWRRRT